MASPGGERVRDTRKRLGSCWELDMAWERYPSILREVSWYTIILVIVLWLDLHLCMCTSVDTAMKIDLACGNEEVVFNKNSGLLTGSKGNECTTWSHLGGSTYSHQFCNFTSGCHSSRN